MPWCLAKHFPTRPSRWDALESFGDPAASRVEAGRLAKSASEEQRQATMWQRFSGGATPARATVLDEKRGLARG